MTHRQIYYRIIFGTKRRIKIITGGNVRILIVVITAILLSKAQHAQTVVIYADTAHYLINQIERKKALFIGKPFSVLIDSLKLKPVDFSIGSNGLIKKNGKYFYLKLEEKQRAESPFIIVGFDSIPEYDKIFPFFPTDSGVVRLQRVLDACRTLIVTQLSVSVYQEEKNIFPTPGRIGAIEVKKIRRDFIRDSKERLTRRKTNEARNPMQESYFNHDGNIIKTIIFENNVEETLKKMDYMYAYVYSHDKLVKELIYREGRKGKLYLDEATKITYDKQGNRFTDSVFHYKKDLVNFFNSNPGLIEQRYSNYQYYNKPKRVMRSFTPNFYYLTTLIGSTDTVKSVQQFSNGRVRWEWNYIYEGNKRTANFQSFYSNYDNVGQKELVTFNSNNQVIEIEYIWIDQAYRNRKRKFYYAKNGILKRIDFYEKNETTGLYEHVSCTFVKMRSKIKMTESLAKKINASI